MDIQCMLLLIMSTRSLLVDLPNTLM